MSAIFNKILLLLIALLYLPAMILAQDLNNVNSFAFALGFEEAELRENFDKFAQYDLLVVDGELISKELVSDFRAQNVIVLGYLSVGTIEDWRSWYSKVQNYRLDLWEEWGEWYADVNDRDFRQFVNKKLAKRILRKNFSGLFLDNVDMVDSHPQQLAGMRKLVRALAKTTHNQGKLLFTQNGDSSIHNFQGFIDGWNREDLSSTYNFNTESYEAVSAEDHNSALDTIQILRAAGIFVTTTDYTDATEEQDLAQLVEAACTAGAIPFISDIYLTQLPDSPRTCH